MNGLDSLFLNLKRQYFETRIKPVFYFRTGFKMQFFDDDMPMSSKMIVTVCIFLVTHPPPVAARSTEVSKFGDKYYNFLERSLP